MYKSGVSRYFVCIFKKPNYIKSTLKLCIVYIEITDHEKM